MEHVVVRNVPLDRVEAILKDFRTLYCNDGISIRVSLVLLDFQVLELIVCRENGFNNFSFPTAVVAVGIGSIQLEQLRELYLAVLTLLAIQVFNGIVEVRHGRIHRGLVVGRYVALLADHEVEEVRKLTAILFLELDSRLFKQTKNLVGIDVIHALGFVDLHSRQNRQLADLMVQRHQGIERLA